MAICDAVPGHIFAVNVKGRWNAAADVVNSFQIEYVDGGTISAATLYNDLGNWTGALLDLVKLFCNALMVWEKYNVAHLDGNCGSGDLAISPTIPGSLENDLVPGGVAALSSFPTGVRRVVPRKYWAGLDSSMIGAGGYLTPTAQGLVEDVNDFLMTPYVTGTQTYRYGYFSPKTTSWLIPNTAAVSNVPAYQRRRRVGTGS